MSQLSIEAEIEGVQEVVSSLFTTYVGFHVVRFSGGLGQIVGDEAQVRAITFDEYRFIGAMATRANKTIRAIKKSIRTGKPPALQSEIDSNED